MEVGTEACQAREHVSPLSTASTQAQKTHEHVNYASMQARQTHDLADLQKHVLSLNFFG